MCAPKAAASGLRLWPWRCPFDSDYCLSSGPRHVWTRRGGHTVNLSVLFNENRVAKNDWAECFTQPSKWLNLLVLNVWHEWPPHGGDKTLSTRPWTEFIPRFRGGARPVCGHENAHRGGAENSPGGALPGAKGLRTLSPQSPRCGALPQRSHNHES